LRIVFDVEQRLKTDCKLMSMLTLIEKLGIPDAKLFEAQNYKKIKVRLKYK
tara:strand:+ start:252 stop:404 length:153 start_codon:yes stop_codon:yes gene_type:complete